METYLEAIHDFRSAPPQNLCNKKMDRNGETITFRLTYIYMLHLNTQPSPLLVTCKFLKLSGRGGGGGVAVLRSRVC